MSARKRVVKVLYIDDREDLRRVFPNFMKVAVHIDTEVAMAPGGHEGVETALRQKPNIIFIDSTMPIMDGIEATRCLKANENLRDVPVIMALVYVERLERQKEAGVAFFVNKPFTPEELESAMRRVLGL